jgi:hypothetical protein
MLANDHRAVRIAKIAAIVLGALSMLACAAFYGLLKTAYGRAQMAAFANRQVSAAIQGSLRIGSITQIDLPHVRARHVALVAPDGVAAIDVDEADVELDLAAIAHGTFAFRRADVRGGIVRVLADDRGRINMQETFRGVGPTTEAPPQRDTLDLQRMATSDMTLIIDGQGLPSLRLENLYGIMRVHVLGDGRTELRFDEYRGRISEGLPTGLLTFEKVKGHVQTDRDRLLQFEGHGRSEGEPVEFKLDIRGEPEKTYIDATFPSVSAEAFSTRLVGLWTRFLDDMDLNVRLSKHAASGGE